MTEPQTPDPEPRLAPGTGRRLSLTLITALFVLAVLLYPFNFGSRQDGAWLALTPVDLPDILWMAVLFVPFGVVEGRLARRLLAGHGWAILLVAADVCLLGLVVETAQMWLPDGRSLLVDLVAATFGGTAGGVLADAWDLGREEEREK